MNASDLRAVLLLRATEAGGIDPAAAARPVTGADRAGAALGAQPVSGVDGDHGTNADGADGADSADSADTGLDWAGAEARRRLGAQATPEAWLAERARLRLARLGEQQPAWRSMLDAAGLRVGRGWAAGLLLAAAALGVLGEQVGSTHTIHLLAPPLLGLLAWNLGVYALLAWQALRAGLAGLLRRTPRRPPDAAAAPSGALRRRVRGWVARSGARLATAGLTLDAPRAAAYASFQRDWLALTGPWQARRGVALLHAGAAALALGALASWYTRGLVLDYRAAWDSTFLDAVQVRALLAAVLGPAAALSGQPLPDVAALAGLRAAGGGGESAARWIHLWSLTVLGLVVLPRTLLAGWAAWRAGRLSRQLPLPDDERLRRLLRSASGQRLTMAVLPYSYQVDAARQAALARLLDRLWGPGVLPQVHTSLPMGAEDELPRHLAAASSAALPARVIVLFALAATPERESHGAFLRALAALRGPDAVALEVLVDESGFRQRLAGATLAERLAQRRAAWQALLDPMALTARFIDLGASTATTTTTTTTTTTVSPGAAR
jgi:hypothetical protein